MDIHAIVRQWSKSGDINGAYHRYVQAETPGVGKGFCKAACQYWVSEMERGSAMDPAALDGLIPKSFAGQSQHLITYQDLIRGRGEGIPGMRRQLVSSRNFLGLGDLRSRAKLMDTVLEREGHYIFGASTAVHRPGSGHAVAFSLRNGEFRFFDPNAGIFTARGLTSDRKRAIRGWFDLYWDKLYDGEFHQGSRTLTRYSLEGLDALLDLAADPYTYALIAFA